MKKVKGGEDRITGLPDKAMKKVKGGEDRITGLPDKAIKNVKRSEDRISGLPDIILGHILSYLTAAQSVRTRILSKRWLSVWSYIPFLDLDDSSLTCNDSNKNHAMHSSFIQFLKNVFSLHKAGSLQKLTLKCSKFDNLRVNEWVMSAMRCKVRELDLCISMDRSFNLGGPLFVYQNLVALKLGKNFVLCIPGEVLLPSLKKLHLESIEFSDHYSCPKLFSGCPVLEHLHIEACDMGNVKTLQIIAPALKVLLLHCRCNNDSTIIYEHEVILDAPCLEVLRFECCFLAKSYSFKNVGSLSDTYINVHMNRIHRTKIDNVRESSLQLVEGIANAKVITFTGPTLEVLSFLDLTALPMFNYLTKLELGGHKSCSSLLPKFLANSLFLQELVLDLQSGFCGSFDFEWHDPIQVPRCLLDSLKSVEICGFNGQSNVLKFMKYLVSNAKVLDTLLAADEEEE